MLHPMSTSEGLTLLAPVSSMYRMGSYKLEGNSGSLNSFNCWLIMDWQSWRLSIPGFV
jgi:hypothetical protein